jgi:hypothetical protein
MMAIDDESRELRLSRQAQLITEPNRLSVLFIGTGGIGSNLVHLAVSMGIEDITIVDPDEVAEENIYPGYFTVEDVGISKVGSLAYRTRVEYDIALTDIQSILEEAGLEDDEFDIVVISTDTTNSRQNIWELYGQRLAKVAYIDARMGGYLATIYTIMMESEGRVRAYDRWIKEQPESSLPCGMKSTAPMTKGWIPGMFGRSLAGILNNWPVPYIQRYDLQTGIHLEVGQPPRLMESERDEESAEIEQAGDQVLPQDGEAEEDRLDVIQLRN